jgi:hypothetical protein
MRPKKGVSEVFKSNGESGGFCRRCQQDHLLPSGKARELAYGLMEKLEQHKRLDFNSPQTETPMFSTSSLFGDDRGKMFGVLEGIDTLGNNVILYAFSGQYHGHWLIPGWAPPLFDEQRWQLQNYAAEKRIKTLTARINSAATDFGEKQTLKCQRKNLSQQLMADLHSLYTVKNSRGETAPLASFYSSRRGAPTGAGDCCAPKLLNHAFNNTIKPTGMAEFYWGRTNLSKSRRHGHFYPPCTDKCKPLLGFMLCGLQEQHQSLEFHP